jgi:hypothetical protein
MVFEGALPAPSASRRGGGHLGRLADARDSSWAWRPTTSSQRPGSSGPSGPRPGRHLPLGPVTGAPRRGPHAELKLHATVPIGI